MVNEVENFWSRVEFTMGCWNWTGATNGRYPTIPISNRRSMYAHRWSYQQWIGPLVDGMHIDHLCRNILCVNPRHLEQVTPKVNMERTPRAMKTHCVKNHELSAENVYIKPNGCRACKPCRRISDAKRRMSKMRPA